MGCVQSTPPPSASDDDLAKPLKSVEGSNRTIVTDLSSRRVSGSVQSLGYLGAHRSSESVNAMGSLDENMLHTGESPNNSGPEDPGTNEESEAYMQHHSQQVHSVPFEDLEFKGDHLAILRHQLNVHVYQIKPQGDNTEHYSRLMAAGELSDAMAKLSHTNIVKFVGSAFHQGTLYLLSEHIRAPTLDKHLASKESLSLLKYLEIATHLIRGINWIHYYGRSHGSLQPSHVFVMKGDQVKVTNLSPSTIDSPANRKHTLYHAPEVLEGGEQTPKSDIYSFGVILCEMLLGCQPYNTLQFYAPDSGFRSAIQHGVRPAIPCHGPDNVHRTTLVNASCIASELESLIKQCWDTNPKARPSASTISSALEKMRFKADTDLTQSRAREQLSSTLREQQEKLNQLRSQFEQKFPSDISPILNIQRPQLSDRAGYVGTHPGPLGRVKSAQLTSRTDVRDTRTRNKTMSSSSSTLKKKNRDKFRKKLLKKKKPSTARHSRTSSRKSNSHK